MNEFLLATALLMQEYLFPLYVLLVVLFVTGIMFGKGKALLSAIILGWSMLYLYGFYLV